MAIIIFTYYCYASKRSRNLNYLEFSRGNMSKNVGMYYASVQCAQVIIYVYIRNNINNLHSKLTYKNNYFKDSEHDLFSHCKIIEI